MNKIAFKGLDQGVSFFQKDSIESVYMDKSRLIWSDVLVLNFKDGSTKEILLGHEKSTATNEHEYKENMKSLKELEKFLT